MRKVQSTFGITTANCATLEQLKKHYRLSKSEIVNKAISYVVRGKARKQKVLG